MRLNFSLKLVFSVFFLVIVTSFLFSGCQQPDQQQQITNQGNQQTDIPTNPQEPNAKETNANESNNSINVPENVSGDAEGINHESDTIEGKNETVELEDKNSETEGPVFVIEIKNLALSQKNIVIEKGTTVRWVNSGNNKHKITIYGVTSSPILYKGDYFDYTFDEPGKYVFVSAPFSSYVKGTIIVE